MRAHSLRSQPHDVTPVYYTIRIRGLLGQGVLRSFHDLHVAQPAGETVLTGHLDGWRLQEVLARIEALGLDLVELRRLDAHRP